MKVETKVRYLCDIQDCGLEATVRLTHEMITEPSPFPTYGTKRPLTVELCPAHAESFTLKGTGSWTTGQPLRQPVW